MEDTMTRIAEYQCVYSKEGRVEESGGKEEVVLPFFRAFMNVPVTIRAVAGESREATEDRFAKAVEIEKRGLLFKKITGARFETCQFNRFLPTAEAALKAKPPRFIQSEIRLPRFSDGCILRTDGINFCKAL